MYVLSEPHSKPSFAQPEVTTLVLLYLASGTIYYLILIICNTLYTLRTNMEMQKMRSSTAHGGVVHKKWKVYYTRNPGASSFDYRDQTLGRTGKYPQHRGQIRMYVEERGRGPWRGTGY